VSWARHLPYGQIKDHYTGSIKTRRIKGKSYGVVALSEFLQGLSSIAWET
jgi:hypothetical protein